VSQSGPIVQNLLEIASSVTTQCGDLVNMQAGNGQNGGILPRGGLNQIAGGLAQCLVSSALFALGDAVGEAFFPAFVPTLLERNSGTDPEVSPDKRLKQ